MSEAKTVDEGAPAPPAADGVDPVLGVSEADLNLLDAFYHQLALDAAADPRPSTPEEDADDEWLMERARQRMSMSPDEVRAQRERG
jgi:hypothetical protein